MAGNTTASRPSVRNSTLIGIAIGTGALLLYLAAGILFESWNVGKFSSNLTFERAVKFLLSGMAIATFAIPAALYLHSRIISPVAILCVVIVGWLGIGIGSSVITSGAIFGLAIYALWLSPLYVVFLSSLWRRGVLCPQTGYPVASID